MLKFKTLCAVLVYLSSNLLNEVGLSFFRSFEVGLRVCDIVVKKFTFAISSPDEFLLANVNDVTFAICYRNSVCLSSVTLVHPTQLVEIFGNFSSPYDSSGILVFSCQNSLVGDAPFP